MAGYIYLNFSDLNDEAQDDLMKCAKDLIDKKELKKECKENGRNYDDVLSEQAQQKLYELDIVFNI